MYHTSADLHGGFGGNCLGAVFGCGFIGYRYIAVRGIRSVLQPGGIIDVIGLVFSQCRQAGDGEAAGLTAARPVLLRIFDGIAGHCDADRLSVHVKGPFINHDVVFVIDNAAAGGRVRELVVDGDGAIGSVRILAGIDRQVIDQLFRFRFKTQAFIQPCRLFVPDIEAGLSDFQAVSLLPGHYGDGSACSAECDLLTLFQFRQGDGALEIEVPGKCFAVGKSLIKGDVDQALRGDGVGAGPPPIFQIHIARLRLLQGNAGGELVVHIPPVLPDLSRRDGVADGDPDGIAVRKRIALGPLAVLLPFHCDACDISGKVIAGVFHGNGGKDQDGCCHDS